MFPFSPNIFIGAFVARTVRCQSIISDATRATRLSPVVSKPSKPGLCGVGDADFLTPASHNAHTALALIDAMRNIQRLASELIVAVALWDGTRLDLELD